MDFPVGIITTAVIEVLCAKDKRALSSTVRSLHNLIRKRYVDIQLVYTCIWRSNMCCNDIVVVDSSLEDNKIVMSY